MSAGGRSSSVVFDFCGSLKAFDDKTMKAYGERYPNLFRDKVGCFKPEIVSYLPFVSEPDTSSLKQPVLSARMKLLAQKQIDDWVVDGIVKEVDYTPKAVTPILLVPKPHSEDFRLCLDFRLVNSCCRQVYSPPVDRTALINDLPKKKIFSTIDVASAFTCIRLAEHLQTYFGINFDGRFFVFTRCPFGFHNSMHLFLRAIRYSLAKVRPYLPADTCVASYVDDICVASESKRTHQRALHLLFQQLETDGWTVKLPKCKLFQSEVMFLGIRYSSDGTAPDSSVLTKLTNLALPETAGDLRKLFGLALCLQRFNYKLNHILAPLRRYVRSDPTAFKTSRFRSEWKTCLEKLQKNVWTTSPMDHESKAPLTLYVDSSSEAHGAALFQDQKLLTMWSTMNRRPHASSSESEITGLSRALKALRPYLVGTRFTVLTDNRAVLSALSPENQSDVIKRHLDSIQFWFGSQWQIRHIAGAANQLADLLSRSRYLTQRRDQSSIQCMPVEQRPPAEEIKRRLQSAHFGHWSYNVTLKNALMEQSRWKGMEKDVKDFIDRCPNCAYSARPQVRNVPDVQISRKMGEQVHMDHAGPFFDGTHILVIVDNATKYVETFRTSSTNTRPALAALASWIKKWGPISLLCVDNASAWNSDAFREWTDNHGIKVRRAPSYYHQGNGLAERTIQTLQNRIRRMLNGSDRAWPEVIESATDALNTSWHSAIMTTPRTLAKGLDRNGVLMDQSAIDEAWQRAWMNQEAQKEYERRRFMWKHPRRSSELKIGMTVLIHNPLHLSHKLKKLGPTYKGPYVIVGRQSRSTWKIQKPDNQGPVFIIHSSQAKPFPG